MISLSISQHMFAPTLFSFVFTFSVMGMMYLGYLWYRNRYQEKQNISGNT